jgi:iron(III) transport system permease protein
MTTENNRLRTSAPTKGGTLALNAVQIVVAALVALPVIAIIVLALRAGSGESIWDAVQLAQLARNTILLAGLVGAFSLVLGATSAWLVTAYEFPGRRSLSSMALLPLAFPGYIISFIFVDFLDYPGAMQTWMRNLAGWTRPEDYSFPEIRSIGGAAVTLSLTLYPYVYMAARAALTRLPASQIMVARTLGHGPFATFLKIVLPQIRPALVVGVMLVIMECLNDIGSVSFFGVRTFALAIYATWTDQGDLGGAARLSVLLLAVIMILLFAEHTARNRDGLAKSPDRGQNLGREKLEGTRGWLAFACVAMPVLLGFVLPVILLLLHGYRRLEESMTAAFGSALLNTLLLAGGVAAVTILLALVMNAGRGKTFSPALRFFSSMGYAVPGTILAIGILIPLSALDRGLNNVAQTYFGFLPGLMFSGTVFALLLAYVTRFQIVASSMISTGFNKIPQNLGDAARSLGRTPFKVFREIELPLLRPALITGFLLVFVDAMKELPATLLLRPFDFETLATLTFSSASLGLIEQAALPALAIVAAGLVPITILMASLHDPGE